MATPSQAALPSASLYLLFSTLSPLSPPFIEQERLNIDKVDTAPPSSLSPHFPLYLSSHSVEICETEMAERTEVQVGIGLDQGRWRSRIEWEDVLSQCPPNLWYPKAWASVPPISSSVSVHGPTCLPALALKIQGPNWLLDRHNRAGSLPPTGFLSRISQTVAQPWNSAQEH